MAHLGRIQVGSQPTPGGPGNATGLPRGASAGVRKAALGLAQNTGLAAPQVQLVVHHDGTTPPPYSVTTFSTPSGTLASWAPRAHAGRTSHRATPPEHTGLRWVGGPQEANGRDGSLPGDGWWAAGVVGLVRGGLFGNAVGKPLPGDGVFLKENNCNTLASVIQWKTDPHISSHKTALEPFWPPFGGPARPANPSNVPGPF